MARRIVACSACNVRTWSLNASASFSSPARFSRRMSFAASSLSGPSAMDFLAAAAARTPPPPTTSPAATRATASAPRPAPRAPRYLRRSRAYVVGRELLPETRPPNGKSHSRRTHAPSSSPANGLRWSFEHLRGRKHTRRPTNVHPTEHIRPRTQGRKQQNTWISADAESKIAQ